jgi:hypothetical protein
MYHVNSETLAHAKEFIGLKPVDMSHVPLPDVVTGIINYEHNLSHNNNLGTLLGDPIEHANVEMEAARFYLYNHAFSLLCAKHDTHEKLPYVTSSVVNAYPHILSEIGRRLVSYTLMVCVREARHLSESDHFRNKLVKRFGQEFRDWRGLIPLSSDGAVKYLKGHPIKMPIGKFCKGLTYVFNKGSFSGGYGGKPWGNIANTLEKYVTGVISLEAFIDTAWTLAHNNGPMFNKGLLYESYGSDLIKILDVQASGQIPQLLNDVRAGNYNISNIKHSLNEQMDVIYEVLPELDGTYVDWNLVEAASVNGHTYANMLHNQYKKHGLPPAEQAKVDAEKLAQQAEDDSKFYVAPGIFAKKIGRAA